MDIDTLSSRCTKYDLIQYPNLRWNRNRLSMYITVSCIRMYLPNAVGEWDWYMISKGVTYEDVLRYPSLPWSIDGLSSNSDIPISHIIRMTNRDTIPISRTYRCDVEIICQ